MVAQVPAPVKGWFARETPLTTPQDGALILDNFFPESGYVRSRKGCKCLTPPLTGNWGLINYVGGTGERLFAVTSGGIEDLSFSVLGDLTDKSFTTIIGNVDLISTHMFNAAGQFLYCVNGVNHPLHFNGTAWALPSFYGSTGVTSPPPVTPSSLNFVWNYSSRLFFLANGKAKFYYLNTLAIAGELGEFNVDLQYGGSLIAGGTWTHDAGNGMNDSLVLVSSEGEMIVYNGDDPSDFARWSLQGRFFIGKPVSNRCMVKMGGDLLILTDNGLVSCEKSINADFSQADLTNVAVNIQKKLNETIDRYKGNNGWHSIVWSSKNMLMVNAPRNDGLSLQFAANTISWAWGRFSSVNARVFCEHDDRLFFTKGSQLFEFEVSSDDTMIEDDLSVTHTPVSASMLTAFNSFGDMNNVKAGKLAQPIASLPDRTKLGINAAYDGVYKPTTPVYPYPRKGEAGGFDIDNMWDKARWDESAWQATVEAPDWLHIDGIGHQVAIVMETQSPNSEEVEAVEVYSFNLSLEMGAGQL
jgi:hypothetical protein